MSSAPEQDQHVDVGAFVLGVLDPAEAARFEVHLGTCDRCAAEFDDLIGLEPILADFAASAPNLDTLSVKPTEGMLDKALNEISNVRARQRRKRFYLVAAAAALIIGGPVGVGLATAGGDTQEMAIDPNKPAQFFFDHIPAENKVSGSDPVSKVNATVGVESKTWGTHVVLKLGNITGEKKCDLVAVGKNGEEQVITTWSVPKWGYGIKDSTNKMAKEPLYMHGGAAMNPTEIDHFEIRTLDGDQRLIRMKALDKIKPSPA